MDLGSWTWLTWGVIAAKLSKCIDAIYWLHKCMSNGCNTTNFTLVCLFLPTDVVLFVPILALTHNGPFSSLTLTEHICMHH
jgi:hypothetical protein